MKLKFLPAGDAHPLEPHAPLAVGQPARRIGRKFDWESKTYPLSGSPYQCEDGTREAARCRKMLRVGDIVAADEQTAKACGVKFVTKKGDK